MTSPIFFNELPIEQTLNAEQLYYDNKPHTTYYLATNGAKTKQGGLLKASSDVWKVRGLSVGRVGDDVIYADGTISKIYFRCR